jgi:hypothetical protein
VAAPALPVRIDRLGAVVRAETRRGGDLNFTSAGLAFFLCLQVAMIDAASGSKDRIADWDDVTLRSRIHGVPIEIRGKKSATGKAEISLSIRGKNVRINQTARELDSADIRTILVLYHENKNPKPGNPPAFRIQLKYGAWKAIAQNAGHARSIIEFTISEGRHSGTGLQEIHEDGRETFTPLDSLGKRER